MPRRAKAKGLYQRGAYWLDWDRRADGSLRTPFLTIFWYDAERGRTRSASTGSGDVADAKAALDRHYLEHSEGEAICPTCGQRRQIGDGFLVLQAIQNYLATRADNKPVGHRMAHVTAFIAESGQVNLTCRQANEEWAARFRIWAAERRIVSPTGITRDRSPSTIENSLIQLAAAINAANKRGDSTVPAQFKPIPTVQLNRSPTHRSDVAELAAMFRYATDTRFPVKRAPLHRYLMAAVATIARPEEVHDISTKPEREQWNAAAGILNLNPRGRRQTRKYRATVPVPWQFARRLKQAAPGFYVGAKSVKSAWESMAEDIGLPGDGAAGMKLIRRSMAKLLRDRLPKADWPEIEMFLGHDKFDSTTSIYAPFDPGYLGAARAELERIIDEIEALVPGAFHRTSTGETENVVPISASKKAG